MSGWTLVYSRQAQKDAKMLATSGLKPRAQRLLDVITEDPFDLEPRIALAPYAPHDDVLDATEARLHPAEREAQRQAQDEFLAALKAGARR